MAKEKSPPVSPATLADWVRDARAHTLALVNDLSDQQLLRPRHGASSPPLWEIGHLAWVQEKLVLRRGDQPSVRSDADALYDLGAVPESKRRDLSLPSREETGAYLQQVQDRILECLQQNPSADDLLQVHRAVLQEDMRGEILLEFRQTLGYPAPYLATAPSPPVGPLTGDAEIPGGTFVLGCPSEEPLAFDHEKPAHPVAVNPFRIARAAVTQGEFAAFVERGGYFRPDMWSADGWRWRQATDARQPVYWRRASNGAWQRRHFDQWLLLEPYQPMVHVNWYEAEAYCRWVNRRLPTEAEWEAAAAGEPGPAGGLAPAKRRFPWGDSPPEPGNSHLDGRSLGCADVAAHPAGDSAFGCRQMIGNVWEWTATEFQPYPGFQPNPVLAFFPTWNAAHKVMRGGGWATRSRLIRNTWRSASLPDCAEIAVGFRTCAR